MYFVKTKIVTYMFVCVCLYMFVYVFKRINMKKKKDCSSRHDLSKNMAARGRGLFSLYIYIEKINDLLVRNHWTDFSIILQEYLFCNLLPRLFKPFGFVMIHQKTWPPGDGAIYLYIVNFKNLLVRNHWTDFILTAELFPC